MAINVSNNNPRINYTATSGQTVFTVPFEFFASTDLTVYVGGSVLATSAYTVTGGSGSTGSITTSSGQTAGAEIAIVRDVPLERTTDLTSSYSASSLNDQLDRIVTQVADLDDRVSRSISLNDYEVGVSLDLPAKASRLGKTVQFNSTTGALEVGPSGNELTSIASIASEITSLNGIKANITTVAGAISNVNSVGSNISSVTSVASSISNVNTVNTNITNVNSVAGSISDLNDVADSLDQVELVGGSISNVDVVGAAITNVNTVASAISNINTVAGISGNVATVAGITSAISTVNSNATNINLVATNIDDVNDVANVITKVTTVADNIANVNTVAPSVGYLSTIANNIANINTLAPISAHITTVAGVASSVSGAAANAAAAEAAKVAAQAAQAAAELAADNFDDTYLGAKASDPTLDNDGDSLGNGDLYFNTTDNILKVYNDSAWQAAALDASGFVNVTGDSMTGNLLFGDGNEARFGTHGDLTIEHDLNNSNIIAANNKPLNITANGGFNINSDNIYFREHAASNTYMEMRDGGGYDHAVRIFHSGTDVRLETTSTGINVTGTVTATGTSVFASLDISGDIDVDGTTNLDATNIVGALDVTGTITSDGLTVKNPNVSGEQVIFKIENAANTGTIGQITYNQTDDSMAISNESTGILRFDTLAKERMRISSGGDISFYEDTGTTAKLFWDASAESLGIGTSSPSGSLHLLTPAGSSGNENTKIPLIVQENSFSSANLLELRNSVGGALSAFDQSGNLGIGCSPAYVLDVQSSSDPAQIRLKEDGNTTGFILKNYNGNEVQLVNADNGPMVFKTDDSEAMRIDSSGSVGIGCIPDSTVSLDVQNLSASSNNVFLRIKNATNLEDSGLIIEGQNGGAREYRIGVNSIANSPDLTFSGPTGYRYYVGGTERMRIDSSGNVGIGAASPSSTFRTSIYGDGSSIIGGVEFRNAASGGSTFTIGHASATSPSATLNVTDAANLIFKTNNTEAMRIDSSGNLLVSKTSADGGVAGFEARSTGETFATSSGATLYAKRTTGDGDIIIVQGPSGTVGSIGVADGDNLVIAGSATAHGGFKFSDTTVTPYVNATNSDNEMDIGAAANRFKDLYLSGGIQFDSRSNKLDDYEEGTFTPTYVGESSSITATLDIQVGFYTRIGDTVFFRVHLGTDAVSGGSTSVLTINGLPFATNSGRNFSGNVGLNYTWGSNSPIYWYANANESKIFLYKAGGANLTTNDLATGANSNRIWIQGQYTV